MRSVPESPRSRSAARDENLHQSAERRPQEFRQLHTRSRVLDGPCRRCGNATSTPTARDSPRGCARRLAGCDRRPHHRPGRAAVVGVLQRDAALRSRVHARRAARGASRWSCASSRWACRCFPSTTSACSSAPCSCWRATDVPVPRVYWIEERGPQRARRRVLRHGPGATAACRPTSRPTTPAAG